MMQTRLRSDVAAEAAYRWSPPSDAAAAQYTHQRIEHWERMAAQFGEHRRAGKYYYDLLSHVYHHLIPPGLRVLEVGCGIGDILAAVKPAVGVGIDFSPTILGIASKRHPHLRFVEKDAHDLATLGETFDAVILSDVLNDLWDVQKVLEQVAAVSHAGTRVIINVYSRVWELPLMVAAHLGLAKAMLRQNWLTVEDLTGLLTLTDFEVIRSWQEILMPLRIPMLSRLLNRYGAKVWPLRLFALTNFIVARPRSARMVRPPKVSVIVPARNEAGNIRAIFERTPELGSGTELIFVEGHSADATYETIEECIANYPERDAKVYKQAGTGKGDAVRLGFSHATGDILMILDADLTVPPEDLQRFYDALVSGKAEFVNGVRLVYPMEAQAMRVFNFLGNKFFSLAFTWLLGQSVKDTLCGTKVLWRSDYEQIAANRGYFGDFDPFGDFDLLFGAAKLNLKILDMPIRYRERTYGTTNIQRWRHGLLLLRMVAFAARRVKFV
jgi:ubiquinone/menaquinone biosynthesis C-methylase UbiE